MDEVETRRSGVSGLVLLSDGVWRVKAKVVFGDKPNAITEGTVMAQKSSPGGEVAIIGLVIGAMAGKVLVVVNRLQSCYRLKLDVVDRGIGMIRGECHA